MKKYTSFLFYCLEIKAKDPDKILDILNKCPFTLTGFKLSGFQNIIILIASPNLRFLDKLVNHHFRSNNYVNKATIEIIIEVSNDLILPLKLGFDQCDCPLKELCVKLKSL